MDEDFVHAVNGDWDALLTALRNDRALAHKTDASGMTLLHWVCLHQTAPTEVLVKIVFANPHVVHARTEAGHLPIDLAIQAECEDRILEVLRAAESSGEDDEAEYEVHDQYQHEPEPSPLPPSAYSPSVGPRPTQQHPNNQNQRKFSRGTADDMIYGYTSSHNGGGSVGYPEHQQQQRVPDRPRQYSQQYSETHSQYSDHSQQQQYGNQPPPTRSNFGGVRRSPSTPSDRAYGTTYGGDQKPLHSLYNTPQPGDFHARSMSVAGDRLHARDLDQISNGRDDFTRFQKEMMSDTHSVMSSHMGDKWKPKNSMAKTAFPPRWKQTRSCHVCMSSFGLMKRRHHCRNCGFSVCSQHSMNRVALPKYGLMNAQRVCDKCFLAGRHLMETDSVAETPQGSEQRYAGEATYGHNDRPFGHHHHEHPFSQSEHRFGNSDHPFVRGGGGGHQYAQSEHPYAQSEHQFGSEHQYDPFNRFRTASYGELRG